MIIMALKFFILPSSALIGQPSRAELEKQYLKKIGPISAFCKKSLSWTFILMMASLSIIIIIKQLQIKTIALYVLHTLGKSFKTNLQLNLEKVQYIVQFPGLNLGKGVN